MIKRNPLVSAFKDMIYFGMESFGRYYSSYRAFVIDNNDPLFLQRLKLLIPEIGGGVAYEYWAIPKGVFYGQGYGTQMIPPKGDVVWVEFERGHPDVPIYSLGHPGHNELPPGDDDLKDPGCYWFKTPAGAVVKINDTKNYIYVSNRDGNAVELNSTGVSLISSKSVSLGTLNTSAQKALLGDNTKDLLTTLKDFCDLLSQSLTKDAGTLAQYAPNTIAAAPQLVIDVVKMVEQLELILSNINTLD